MPSHVHFIVCLGSVGAQDCAPTFGSPIGQRQVDKMRTTLGQAVRAFKAAITKHIRLAGADEFAWQRNYYERTVRNERELNVLRQCILDSPSKWAEDAENAERAR